MWGSASDTRESIRRCASGSTARRSKASGSTHSLRSGSSASTIGSFSRCIRTSIFPTCTIALCASASARSSCGTQSGSSTDAPCSIMWRSSRRTRSRSSRNAARRWATTPSQASGKATPSPRRLSSQEKESALASGPMPRGWMRSAISMRRRTVSGSRTGCRCSIFPAARGGPGSTPPPEAEPMPPD